MPRSKGSRRARRVRKIRTEYFSRSEARLEPCPACGLAVKTWMPAGMSQMCPHFYCDRCNNAICRESDKEMAWKEKSSAVLLRRIAGSLPHCPCGGRFSPGANPKCPFCRHEFKHGRDPVTRLDDPFLILVDGAVLFGDEDDPRYPYQAKVAPWWIFW